MRFLSFAMVILLAYLSSGLVCDYLKLGFAKKVSIKESSINTERVKEKARDYSIIWRVFDLQKRHVVEGKNITGGDLRLLGISFGERSYAVIEDSVSKRVFIVKEGDSIGDLKVVNIGRDRVSFTEGGQRLFLTFIYSKGSVGKRISEKGTAISKESDYSYAISRSLLFSEFSNVSKLLTKINVAPYIKNKEVQGYLIRWMSKYSILRKMGLRTGDIIREINGIPLKQPQDIYNIMKSAMSSDVIKVRITRANKDILLEYDIR